MLIKNLLNLKATSARATTLLVTTDLEGDDLIALTLFAKQLLHLTKTHSQLKDTLTLIFLVGEGSNVELKKQRMLKYITLLGLDYFSTLVYSGFGSSKEFWGEGSKTFTPEEISEFAKIPTINHDQYVAQTDDLGQLEKKFLEIGFESPESTILIISLKPMTELMWLWVKGSFNAFHRKNFIGYMSFNARLLFSYNNLYRELIPKFLKEFENTYLYETFTAVGKKNNVTSNSGFDFSLLPQNVQDDLTLWNQFCYDDCVHSLEHHFYDIDSLTNQDIEFLDVDDDTKDSLKRDLKASNSIKSHISSQFVNADPAIIFWLFSETDLTGWEYKIYGSVYFSQEGYTHLRYVDRSWPAVVMLTSEDEQEEDELRDLQVEFYKETLLM